MNFMMQYSKRTDLLIISLGLRGSPYTDTPCNLPTYIVHKSQPKARKIKQAFDYKANPGSPDLFLEVFHSF